MSTATSQRALVIAPQWVGDAIMSLSLLQELQKTNRHVDVLATPAVEAVYRCHVAVHELIVAPFVHGKLQWQLRSSIASKLRGRYDKAIVLPNSFKSALVPWLARIPIRRGTRGESRYVLINDVRAAPALISQAKGRPSMLDQYLSLADVPLAPHAIDRFGEHRPRMAVPRHEAGLGQHGLSQAELDAVLAQKLLALCPGAEYGPAKQWPAQHFAAAANAWLAKSEHHHVLIIGSAKDMAIANEIAGAIHHPSRVLHLCGKTKLIQAFEWLSRSAAVLSNDSGLMHAAAALGRPVVGIFGSSDAQHTPPHSSQSRALSLHLPCSPCFKRVCPLGTTACLKDLGAQRAIDAINELVADAQAARDAAPRASP